MRRRAARPVGRSGPRRSRRAAGIPTSSTQRYCSWSSPPRAAISTRGHRTLRRLRLSVLGGTFDHLHVGHQALLATAFQVGEEVAVGITTDRFVADHPKPLPGRIQPFRVRRATLVRWVRRNFPRRKWRVVPLETAFGRSVDLEVDALVVSRDTVAGGRAVNRERRRLGRPTIPLVIVPLALADDLEPVSSRRVRAGAIGTDGGRHAPIRVAVATADPRDRSAAERAVHRVFPRVRLVRLPTQRPPLRKTARRAGRVLASRSDGPPDLVLRVARRRTSGWTATERSARIRLAPRAIPGSRSADLERGLLALLRPRQ